MSLCCSARVVEFDDFLGDKSCRWVGTNFVDTGRRMLLRRQRTWSDGVIGTKRARYSNDAICVGALWWGDRTLPSVIPTKNITASITAIAPSFRGGLSLRICLSKSSSSRWFILEVPIFVPNETQLCSIGNAVNVSLFH
jgi:hypothetical protein